jgi:hypothetical protein
MNRLVIAGAEPHTRDNAPFGERGYDVWTFADWGCKEWAKFATAIIEIHRPHGTSGYTEHPRSPEYWEWLQNTDKPVYMYPADSRIKNSIEYPLDEVKAMLGNMKNKGMDFQPLNSSLAYAIALGIYQGYEQIDIYGVELTNSSEYRSQQPMFTFWVGFAGGRGIKLNINCTDGLFIQPLYGIEQMYNNDIIHKYIEDIEKQQTEALQIEWAAKGALQVLRSLLEQ